MANPNILALDQTARRIDVDGRLHVDRSHISKATVNPYFGKEIPGWQALGLNPDTVYRLYRDPAELEKGAATFARLPILSKHTPVNADTPHAELVVGSIGSEVVFSAPYLDADLCIWDAAAIAGIESGQVKELSCGYRYVPVMEPGTVDGQEFDGRMTEIVGNHLALVEAGRAGSDVVVADHNPFIIRKPANMKMTKIGHALFTALSLASPVLAQDSAFPALLATADRKTLNKDEIKAKVLALDSNLQAENVDSVIDAIMGVEENPDPIVTPAAAADDVPAPSKADQLRQLLAGKVDDDTIASCCGLLAQDEEEEDDKKVDVKTAMDGLRAELRAAAEAAKDVRAIVGEVVGMDSAADIYGFALDHLKVDRKGVEGAAALRALYRVAVAGKTIAQDSKPAPAAPMFPGLSRFKTV